MSAIETFQLNFPELVQQMKDTSHHYNNFHLNPYHLEGDIWSHTLMTYNYSFDENLHSDFVDLELLNWVTLLHDIGKCYTRKEEDGDKGKKTTFYGHAGLSYHLAISILEFTRFNQEQKRLILEAISLHHSFMDLLNPKIDDKSFVKKMRRFKNNRWLFELLLAQMKCDSLGRIMKDRQSTYWELEHLHRKFKQWDWDEYIVKPNDSPTCIILCGVPNSGKSSLIKHAFSKGWLHKDTTIISSDNIIEEIGKGEDYNEKFSSVNFGDVEKIMENRFMECLRENKTFIIDRTNVSVKSRRKFLGRLKKNYITEAWVLPTSYSTCLNRNKIRKGKVLPQWVIEEKMQGWVVPLYDDFDNIIWHFNQG